MGNIFAFQKNFTRIWGTQTQNGLRQFGLAVALHARDCNDFSALYREGDVIKKRNALGRKHGDRFEFQSPTSGRCGSFLNAHHDRAAHHLIRQF